MKINLSLVFLLFLLSIFYFLFSIYPYSPASAAIGVSPEKLEFTAPTEQSLFLRNYGETAEKIIIEHTSDITVTPAEFYLSPNESLTVKISPKQKNIQTELAIISQSNAAAELRVASGIKIPVTAKSGNSLAWVLPYMLALAVTVGSYFVFKKQM